MVIEGKQIKEWVERAYNNAAKHGWYEVKKPTTHWVMMISTEVTEAVQADRKGRWMDDLDKSGLDCVIANDHHGGLLEKFYGEHIEGTVESELADICIRTFSLMGLMKAKVRKKYEYSEEEVELCNTRDFTINAFFLSRNILSFISSNNPSVLDIYCERIFVSTFVWAESLGIDLIQHINLKMRYNETREYHHGGKKY